MIIVANMMHMKRAMRPIMTPKRVGIICCDIVADGSVTLDVCVVSVVMVVVVEVVVGSHMICMFGHVSFESLIVQFRELL